MPFFLKKNLGLFWASVLSLTFPRMLEALGSPGAFGFYAGLNMAAFVMIFFLVPGTLSSSSLFSASSPPTNHSRSLLSKTETKQRTLEELDYVFAVPVARHASYQFHKSLPYFIKRWIFFNKSAELEPLYDFTQVKSVSGVPEKMSH